jgi:hypothetical protein
MFTREAAKAYAQKRANRLQQPSAVWEVFPKHGDSYFVVRSLANGPPPCQTATLVADLPPDPKAAPRRQWPLLEQRLVLDDGEAESTARRWRRRYGSNASVRVFTRTVKADHRVFHVYVITARRKP